jgi:hypothetical protein
LQSDSLFSVDSVVCPARVDYLNSLSQRT